MTRETLHELQDWLSSLSGDELDGAMDALQAIQGARMGDGGGEGMPIPPEIEIDPELEDPEFLDSPDMDDDLEVEDPDDVLKDKKSDSDEDSDTDDAKDSKDGKGEKDGKKDEEGGKGDGEDGELEDDEVDLPDEFTKDSRKEEQKKHEVFRRKVELASARKQIKRALRKIEKGEVEADPEIKSELEKLDKEAEEKLKELSENPESVTETSAKEFNDFINSIMEKTNALGVNSVKITDMENRLKKIRDVAGDPFTADELEAEDTANRLKDPEFQKMKAREREKERIEREVKERGSGGVFRGDIEAFKLDLKKAIGDQIGDMIEVEEETYARVNRWHEDDDIAAPGIRVDEIPDSHKPSIDVYFDQSGSWGKSEVARGMAAIADIIELEKEGLLNLEIYFFSALLSQDQATARADGRYECWDLVIENINAAPKTKNVIIMTDTDIGHDWRVPGCHGCINGPGTTVDGCVWFLWKGGHRVPSASKKLVGKKGTFEYSV